MQVQAAPIGHTSEDALLVATAEPVGSTGWTGWMGRSTAGHHVQAHQLGDEPEAPSPPVRLAVGQGTAFPAVLVGGLGAGRTSPSWPSASPSTGSQAGAHGSTRHASAPAPFLRAMSPPVPDAPQGNGHSASGPAAARPHSPGSSCGYDWTCHDAPRSRCTGGWVGRNPGSSQPSAIWHAWPASTPACRHFG